MGDFGIQPLHLTGDGVILHKMTLDESNLRDLFAAAALVALSTCSFRDNPGRWAEEAYRLADAMMSCRTRNKESG